MWQTCFYFLESRVEGEGQTSFLLSPVSGGLDKNQAKIIKSNNP